MKVSFEIWRQYCLPQHGLSRVAGYLANCKVRWFKNLLIKYFMQHYAVEMTEAKESNPYAYPSFNDFFGRALKDTARSWHPGKKTIASSADGTIYQHGRINNSTLLTAKGRQHTIDGLLGQREQQSPFRNGYYYCIYLAPHNYHRVHMPIDGKLVKTRYIPGRLFSVNKNTARNVPQLFSRNERLVCFFESELGAFAVILVGAMIVGSISTPWAGTIQPLEKRKINEHCYKSHPLQLKKGDEMGRFTLGSTAILLFENEVKPDDRLCADSEVWLGEGLGTICEQNDENSAT